MKQLLALAVILVFLIGAIPALGGKGGKNNKRGQQQQQPSGGSGKQWKQQQQQQQADQKESKPPQRVVERVDVGEVTAEEAQQMKGSCGGGVGGGKGERPPVSGADVGGRLWYALFKHYRPEVAPCSGGCAPAMPGDATCDGDPATAPDAAPHIIRVGLRIIPATATFISDDELLEAEYYMSLRYTDPRLSWSPADYNNIHHMSVPAVKLWIPDVKLVNRVLSGVSYDDWYKALGQYPAILNHTGEVSLAVPSTSKTYCHFDDVMYQAVCSLPFVSWSHPAEELELELWSGSAAAEQAAGEAEQECGDPPPPRATGEQAEWALANCTVRVAAASAHPVWPDTTATYSTLTYTYYFTNSTTDTHNILHDLHIHV